MIETNFRDLTPTECSWIQRLLEGSFEGKTEVTQQLRHVKARIIDEDGSLELCAETGNKAQVITRVPVEAWAADTDGINVNFLLHVVDGVVKELEIYKSDSTPIIRMPPPSEWELFEPR